MCSILTPNYDSYPRRVGVAIFINTAVLLSTGFSELGSIAASH
jgi:hypothetical protein